MRFLPIFMISPRTLAGQYDHVFFNPPYNDEASSLSGDSRRREAMAGMICMAGSGWLHSCLWIAAA